MPGNNVRLKSKLGSVQLHIQKLTCVSKKCQYSCDVAYPKFSTLVKVDCISQSLSRGVIIGKTIKKAILLKFSDIQIKPISKRGRQTIHPHIGFVSPQKILRLHPCVSIMLLYSSESKKRKKMSNCHRGCQSKKMEKLLLHYKVHIF